MIFKMYDCDFGIKIDGIKYDFDHVDSLVIEDPELNKLVRGANAGDKVGIVYREGLKEPKRITVTILNMDATLKGVLDGAFVEKTRLDVFCVSRVDGSSKIAKQAILSMQPIQLNIEEGVDSMNVSLVFESFDLTEVHKN